MTETKKQSRKGRSPAGDATKKVVSLTLDPALIDGIDKIAKAINVSRSKAVEIAITGLIATPPSVASTPVSAPSKDAALSPHDCMFASPQMGQAISYQKSGGFLEDNRKTAKPIQR
jgi:hypothetical protein